MLTDKKMLNIAERYLKSRAEKFGGADIEVVILTEEIIKKPYGNIYYYQSKKFLVTKDFNDSLGGNGPFLVEKKTGRVVAFGTSMDLQDYIKSYENGTLGKTSTRYWYPDEDRFDYK
jgi:hypothetical protein